MADKSILISVDGQPVKVGAVARQLGVSQEKLVKAITLVGSSKGVGVDAFYQEWLEGLLPVKVMPCRSTSLYRLYAWWCKQKGTKVLSEVMLLRTMPQGLSKSRRWVKSGGGMKTMTMVEPDSWHPHLELPMAEELAEYEDEFSRQVAELGG